MPIVDFSDSDLLRNKILTPGWYRVHIDTVGEWVPSKDGNSQNIPVSGTVKFNADDNSTEFAGVPLDWLYNSNPKVKGFIEGFLRGLGVDVVPGRYDLSAAQGKDVDIYIKNSEYNGRLKNEVSHQYRAPRQE